MNSRLRLVAALAAATATSATAYAYSEPSESRTMVCKVSTQAASRFVKRLCFTRAEWDRISESSKRAWSELRDRPAIETRK